MSRTPWDAQEAVNTINNLESELQAEKARADELLGKTEQLEARVAELVGALEQALRYITSSGGKFSPNHTPGSIDKDIVRQWQQALAKAKEATRNTKTD